MLTKPSRKLSNVKPLLYIENDTLRFHDITSVAKAWGERNGSVRFSLRGSGYLAIILQNARGIYFSRTVSERG